MATGASLGDVKGQELGVGSYDEFMQIVGWVSANTPRMAIGATDISPYLSYTTRRLFFDIYWVASQSKLMGLTPDEFMKEQNISIIVVRMTYAQQYGLIQDPQLSIAKTFQDYIIFRFNT
jgi:hypothetical protein